MSISSRNAQGVEEDIIKGMYLLKEKESMHSSSRVRHYSERIGQSLLQSFDIDANVWSVTSFTELARGGLS